jgi:YD repeat-containing protein
MSLKSPFESAPPVSPEQLIADERSRTAFEGLGRQAALELAMRTFHVDHPTWTAPGSEAGTRITRYLSAYTADEERPGRKRVLVQSSVPLQVPNGSGKERPVSVTLREEGEAYTLANPLVPIAISKHAAGGTTFPFGLSVAPTATAGGEAPVVVGDSVLFANTARDTDFITEPLPGGTGADLSWQLRSQYSPQDNALSFTLPPGASLRISTAIPGGAEVVQGQQTLLTIPPASARGADGRPLSVTYSVTGNTLTTHVDLSGSVDFPVLVDPEVIGYYGSGYGWQHWATAQGGGCTCFHFREASYELAIESNEHLGQPQGPYGEWYTGNGGGIVTLTRVDLTGANHSTIYNVNQSYFEAGIYESGILNQSGAGVYTYNGTNPAETRKAPLVEGANFSGRAIAFCAHGAGGYDGGPQPLCNENYGGEGFAFLLYLSSAGQELVTAYAAIGTATVRFIQKAPPTISTAGTAVLPSWTRNPASEVVNVEGKDSGVGVSAVGLDAVSGIRSANEMPTPGSSPAPGTAPYRPACTGDPYCYAWLRDGFNLGQLSTGVWTLGPWTENAVQLATQQTLTTYAYVDKTAPTIETPSWQGATFGDGPHALSFAAHDGTVTEPQSGVKYIDVYVDGVDMEKFKTSCTEPVGVPSAGCFGFGGSWTVYGEKYGAGPHTITLKGTDWVGNQSERSFQVTINHPVNETQQLGPGALNLITGDYKLSATDATLPGLVSLTVSRTYDSQAGGSGPLGPGWMLALPDTSAAGQWQSLQPLSNGNVEVTTTTGEKVVFEVGGSGYKSPTGYQTYTLTEPSLSPTTYQISDSAGDYTQFTEPSGASAFMPTTVAQASGAGGVNAVTYVLSEGKTTEIVGPTPAGLAKSCSQELVKGCRALELHYTSSSASPPAGEAPGEWGEYPGHLASVTFTAWDPSKGEMAKEISMAKYAYDKQGRLRAEWDSRISPELKTVYGYDSEGHLTVMAPPGHQPWLFHYGTATGASGTGRLLSLTRPAASTTLWNGEALRTTTAPTLTGFAAVGLTLSVSNGAWSGAPLDYEYQWDDCNSSGGECTPILGATNPTYTVATSDIGHTLIAQVTATNGGGSLSVSTAPSAVARSNQEITYGGQFGSAGTGNGQFNHPGAITYSKGNLWVADYLNNRIQEFNEKGEFVKAFGSTGSGNGQLTNPDGVALDSHGNVWVCDHGDSRIEEFNEKGEYVKAFGSPGSGLGQMEKPEGVTIDPHGNIWVSDTYNGRLEEFNEKGESPKIIGSKGSGPGQIGESEGVAADLHGNVWVADWLNNRVEEFNEKGEFVKQFGSEGSGNGQLKRPYGIAVDESGGVWVADTQNNRLEEFNEKGEYANQFGSSGSGPGQFSFSWPIGDAVDSKGDIWVTDPGNNRVEQWFVAITGTSGEAAPPPGPRFTVAYHVPLSGSGLPNLSEGEVAKWAQKGVPAQATAIFPPDEPQVWPASDYKRATIYYFDATDRRVNVASPGGAIATTQYETYGNVERTLTPGNRKRALEAGSESAAKSELLDTQTKHSTDGTELESSLGPLHEVKLANGKVVQARAHTTYTYDQGAPGKEALPGYINGTYHAAEVPYRLVTTTSEGAQVQGGGEEDVRTIKDSYAGQEGLGWKLRKTTSVTTEPQPGHTSTRTTVYDPKTGDVTESTTPAGNSTAPQPPVYSSSFGSAGAGNGQFNHPGAVTVDSGGNLWVADHGNYRVEEFSSGGTFIETFGWGVADGKAEPETCGATGSCKAGIQGSGSGQLNSPDGVAIDSHGNVWVADHSNYRVEEFSSGGTFIKVLGWGVENGEAKAEICTKSSGCKAGIQGSGPGQLSALEGIAVDAHGNVWASDTYNGRLEVFNEKGEFQKTVGSKGTGENQLGEPEGIAIDTTHHKVWVADWQDKRVEEFNEEGGEFKQFGTAGSGPGQFTTPYGIAVDQNSGNVWVADSTSAAQGKVQPLPTVGYSEIGGSLDYFGSQRERMWPYSVTQNGELLKLTAYLRPNKTGGSAKQKLKGLIYADASGKPGALLGETAELELPEGFTAGWYDLTFASPINLSGGSTYWIGVMSGLTEGVIGWNYHSVPASRQYTAREYTKGPLANGSEATWTTDSQQGSLYGTYRLSVGNGNNRVEGFSEKGEYLTQFGTSGSGPGQFSFSGWPIGLGVDSKGAVWLTDPGSNRVELWRPATPAAHTSRMIYYSAGTESTVAACQNRPEWANLPCQAVPAAQPQGSLGKLPVTTTTYNVYDQPQTVKSEVGSSTRTTTNTYDAAGRILESSISSTSGKALPALHDEYDPKTGALIKQSTSSESTSNAYNTLGQLTSYTDASHNVSSYTYDVDGRVVEARDGAGTRTNEYDATTGQLTGLKDSAAGTFSATYNAEGQLATQRYPNGMTATFAYNATGQAISLVYTKGSSTWYSDTVLPSIHGQWMTQQSTLQTDSYAYDGLGRLTEAQETPQGKGCTTALFAYDEDSNRISQTKREPVSGGGCASEGGTSERHVNDEADRLTDAGAQYGPFGENTVLPASDAGGHALETSYFAGGALYKQTQNGTTNTYALDPVGRVRETTAESASGSKTTISHYSGSASAPAWTEAQGGATFSRNVAGIGGSLCAIQTNTSTVIQIANLHGDIIGTAPDNEATEKPTLTTESTAFGVPTSPSTSKYGWLGSAGLPTEFLESGIASSSAGSYVPQLGIHLAPVGLSAAASQDPVNEYLANGTIAQPSGETVVVTMPGAIEPLPVNSQVEQEFWEHPPWDKPPVNAPAEEGGVGEGEGEGEESLIIVGEGATYPASKAIVCTSKVNNPHVSTHGPETVNVVATLKCPQVVGMYIRVALFYEGRKASQGEGETYTHTELRTNTATTCKTGRYQGWAEFQAQGENTNWFRHLKWGPSVYIRC